MIIVSHEFATFVTNNKIIQALFYITEDVRVGKQALFG